MKKFFLIFIGLVLLIAGGVAYYILNMDWNKHKDAIANQFHELTGKYVKLDGNVTLKIFPAPYINVNNARIFSEADDKKPVLTIRDAMADLDLIPLLQGNVKIKKMVLDGAVLNVDLNAKEIKWQSDLTADQRAMFENNKNILSSISLKNAEVNFETGDPEKNTKLTKLNGEVATESLFGPFRIEGNYMKGESPEGFALSIGTIAENMPTTLNAVITHPNSDSFLRFDGTINLSNLELNGGFILESMKVGDFVNGNFERKVIPDEYNAPIKLGFDALINHNRIDLTNVVVKYGDTQGSGSLLFPYKDPASKEIKANFEFAELDVEPFVNFMKELVEKYKTEPYDPDYKYDLDVGVSALKAFYQGQGLKNLKTRFDLKNNIVNLKEFSVVLPGDTLLKTDGRIYAKDEKPIYRLNLFVEAVDLLKTMQWLDINPENAVQSVYKKMILDTKIDGDYERIQFSPYKVTLDKTTLTGNARLFFKDRKYLMLLINGDTINLDNYFPPKDVDDEGKTTWLTRAISRFGKNKFLREMDLVMDTTANLIIYESMPFEKVAFKVKLLDGNLEIENALIGEVANTSVYLSGAVSGFDTALNFTDLNYDFKSSDLMSFINKFELSVPEINYNEMDNIELNGIINGSFDNMGINSNVKIGEFTAAYEGTVVKDEKGYNFDGKMKAHYPEFNSLLQNFNLNYSPMASNLGIFNFKANVKGNKENLLLSEMTANVGYVDFVGDVEYQLENDNKIINSNLKVNMLEIERFLVRSPDDAAMIEQQAMSDANFLSKPVVGQEKINYEPYKNINFNGVFDVAELSYKGELFKNSKFRLVSAGNEIRVNDFVADYKETPLTAQLFLDIANEPKIDFTTKIENAKIVDFPFGGREYGLSDGEFSLTAELSSSAVSKKDFIDQLSGKIDVNVANSSVRGLNLKPVYDDLLVRISGDGLGEAVDANIGSGETSFERILGRVLFDKGNFSLQNASMASTSDNVTLSGGGNLKNWTMDVIFNVKFKDITSLPGFSFTLKGDMSNPEKIINVSDIQKVYFDRDKEEKALKEAKEQAEKDHWQSLVDEQKVRADVALNKVRNEIDPKIDDKIIKVFVPDNITKFEALKKEAADEVTTLIDKVNGVDVNSMKVTQDVIDELAKANDNVEEKLKNISQLIDEVYLEDLKKQYATEYTKIVELNNTLKQKLFEYNAVLNKFDERLKTFETDYKMREDADFKAFDDLISQQAKFLEQYEIESNKINEEIVNESNIEKHEENNPKMKEIYLKLQDAETIINENEKKPDELILPKIDAAEDAYKQKVKEEEERRMIEENTGSISIKKTGKKITVVRDINEIKEAEDKINNEKIKVLDFTGKKNDKKKDDETTDTGVIKKGRNIISF